MTQTSSMPAAVAPAELQDYSRQGASVTLLDVRTPAEFETIHIPGSYNVPLDLLPEHRAELAGLGQPVVLVCRSGNRANQAEQVLRDASVDRLHVLSGGIQAWEAAGLPVKRGRARWSLERQVRAIAGSLVLLGTLGSLLVWPPLIGLAIFVGAGLTFAGLTDNCMMGMLLARLPYNRGASCDVAAVIGELRGRAAEASA